MKTIHGVYTSAIIYHTNTIENSVDDYAIAQIKQLCDNKAFKDCKIRIMPDVHPGKVGTIGFTSTIGTAVIPNVIGVDIGCGVTVAAVKGRIKEYQKLDTVIRDQVPSGFSVRSNPHHKALNFDLQALRCFKHINEEKARLSLGTLGGGNHFIELDVSDDGTTYLLIHSGSRHLGHEVTEHYLREGQKQLKEKGNWVPYELTYLKNELMKDYLHDLAIVQDFASLNREIMVDEIVKGMNWKATGLVSCVLNYVDFRDVTPIIRKGAISARKGETVIIPINMKDGVIVGAGLGNADWNDSAPHGAGRIMKREDVKNSFTVSSYKKEMKGIYSSCINRETLDEAPFAYRSIDAISDAVKDTIQIQTILRPVYNFKAGGDY